MKKWLTALGTLFLSTQVAAAGASRLDLRTPRGALIHLDVYNSAGATKALLLAPGRSCSPRMDMYDIIAAAAAEKGWAVVRLHWAYCVANPTQGSPSAQYVHEKEDLGTALNYIKTTLGISSSNIWVGGKSLGSVIGHNLFMSDPTLGGLVLLTPVCTDISDPKNPKNIFERLYPNLADEKRQIIIVQGNTDEQCFANHFQEFLKDKSNNVVSLVTQGNHGFGIKNPDGSFSNELGWKNLAAISSWIFAWLGK